MPIYLITNRVPAGFSPSPEGAAAWAAWFTDLGDHLVDRGHPAFLSTTVGEHGPDTRLGGYTLITAEDLTMAVRLVQEHPLLARGGGLEIGELRQLNRGTEPLPMEPPDSASVCVQGTGDESAGGPVVVSVQIAAPPETVFLYVTEPHRYVAWQGTSATLDPRPGGLYSVQMGDGFGAAGEFLEVTPPHRVAFTWGWAPGAGQHVLSGPQPDTALAAGSTRVVMSLEAADVGTSLTLRHHDLPTAELREAHRVAWLEYLQRLALVAAGQDPGPDPHA